MLADDSPVADLLGRLFVSRLIARRSSRAVGVVDSRPVAVRSIEDIANCNVCNDDCLDYAHATAPIGRSVDEDAAHYDDVADANNADVALFLFGAEDWCSTGW